ncbi:DNA mismatch repair protein MutH [Tissierella creatinini]|nr:DNA mismatch repair protein MutH [Tissierella creatinini]TJX63946.1 DNA mismatch repair protein MutH [Soehngenia saccharolytica]
MLLEEAKLALDPIINRKLSDFVTEEQMKDIIRAKGRSGQLMEMVLGLNNTNTTLDFVDGELKTNKCDRYGNPMETMFITQISSIIDDLIGEKNFYETHIYNKISNLLYVPISKEGPPSEWVILPYTHVNLEDYRYKDLKNQLEVDYYSICRQLKEHIEISPDGYIHTSSGEFIQIRSKDSKPYFPIYSNIFGRYVSNKNHAFYFKKEFMRYISSR